MVEPRREKGFCRDRRRMSGETFYARRRAVACVLHAGDVTGARIDQESTEGSQRVGMLGKSDAHAGGAGDQAQARAASRLDQKAVTRGLPSPVAAKPWEEN